MKKLLTAAVCAVSFAVPAAATSLTNTYTSYYAFGDSLTDDGKLLDAALNPVSDDGRFSNGPTWAEYIAAEFDGTGKNTANLAIGGATGDDENFFPINDLSTFAGQIATFTAAVMTGTPLPTRTVGTEFFPGQPTNPGSNPLVSVLFGGNDMFQSVVRAAFNAANGIAETTPQQVLVAAADRVTEGILEIAALEGGSVFDDFLLLTVPGGNAATIYNSRLASNVLDSRFDDLNIITLDTDLVFGEIIFDALANGGATYGISDVNSICTASLSDQGPFCDNPNEIALVDTVHPNAIVHQVLGARAISAVEAAVAPVPLPAGLPLLIGGLGVLGLLRMRKA